MSSPEIVAELTTALSDVGRQLNENMQILVGACASENVDVEALIGLQVVHGQRGQWLAEQVYVGCMTGCLSHADTVATAHAECWQASSALLDMHLRYRNQSRAYVETVIHEFEAAFRKRFDGLMVHSPEIPETVN